MTTLTGRKAKAAAYDLTLDIFNLLDAAAKGTIPNHRSYYKGTDLNAKSIEHLLRFPDFDCDKDSIPHEQWPNASKIRRALQTLERQGSIKSTGSFRRYRYSVITDVDRAKRKAAAELDDKKAAIEHWLNVLADAARRYANFDSIVWDAHVTQDYKNRERNVITGQMQEAAVQYNGAYEAHFKALQEWQAKYD